MPGGIVRSIESIRLLEVIAMTETPDLVSDIEALGDRLAAAKASITKRFIGQERVVDLVLSAILCGGHGLLFPCLH